MKKVVVLASGGLDSSVLLALYDNLGYEVHPLYINYGNRNTTEESSKLVGIITDLCIPSDNVMEIEASFLTAKVPV